ncbi:YceD family protein [Nesterenkonia populi]|uniref:YceD family protein n=1 Tax=Nesterenkonia populi TaxID=1591087 RepID=UPI001FE665C9|nr:YceD family protein [Nesterenkonia populi]
MIHPQQTSALHPAGLSVDVKELRDSPGSSETVQRTVGAPADFATPLVSIEEHSELELDLRFDSVHEGVLATGTASGQVGGQCGRCLDTISFPLTVDVTQLFAWPENAREQVDEEDEDETRAVGSDLTVDLEPVLRDLMVSALPFAPVCREDCPGLCSQCGFRMEDDPDHEHEQLDPRWAELAGLAAQLNETDDEDRSSH